VGRSSRAFWQGLLGLHDVGGGGARGGGRIGELGGGDSEYSEVVEGCEGRGAGAGAFAGARQPAGRAAPFSTEAGALDGAGALLGGTGRWFGENMAGERGEGFDEFAPGVAVRVEGNATVRVEQAGPSPRGALAGGAGRWFGVDLVGREGEGFESPAVHARVEGGSVLRVGAAPGGLRRAADGGDGGWRGEPPRGEVGEGLCALAGQTGAAGQPGERRAVLSPDPAGEGVRFVLYEVPEDSSARRGSLESLGLGVPASWLAGMQQMLQAQGCRNLPRLPPCTISQDRPVCPPRPAP
jgi:hypothetical protein